MRRCVGVFGKYFDEGVKRVQLEAAARVGGSSTEHEFVVAEQTEALLERLDDIREGRFAAVLDRTRGRGGEVVRRALLAARADVKKVTTHTQQDSEADLAVSILSQHWIDDLDQELQIVYNSLKPDAPFVGCMLSTGTLAELRSCLALADMERLGGAVVRTSPLAGPDDLASALGANGFLGTCVDQVDTIPTYSSTVTFLEELFLMGERGALAQQGRASRDSLTAALALYPHLYGDENGRIPVTFRVLWWIAWKPGPNAPQPKKRGSAKRSFKELGAKKD